MSLGGEQVKSDLIARVVEHVHQRLDKDRATWTARFVKQFYAHVPPDDLIGEDPDNLYGKALSIFGLARKRLPGQPIVRVYNPKLEEHGFRSSHTIVEIVNDDMPFLVDSITAKLAEMDAQVYLVIHPTLLVERDAKGRLTDLRETADDESHDPVSDAPEPKAGERVAIRESLMHIQVSEQPRERLEALRAALEGVLQEVWLAVRDWQRMRDRMEQILDELTKSPPPLAHDEIAEGIAFLKWANDNHFTFLGCREYVFEGSGPQAMARVLPDQGLGILSDPEYRVFDGLRNLGKLPPDVRDFLHQPDLLRITKANRRSSVHRPVHMDTIAVKTFDDAGNVTGERLFVGLFTSIAYSRSALDIPLLRRKVDRMMTRSGFRPSSHNGKALLNILETYPRDELFQINEDDLYSIAIGILHLQERQRLALFTRRDPFERFVSCLIYVPRDRYDTNLRLRFQDILAKAYEGEVSAFYTHLTEAVLARVHIIVRTTPGEIPEVDKAALERQMADAARSWMDHLQDALVEERGEEPGLAATRRFGKAFPASYQEHFRPANAVFDIERIEEALATDDLAMNLYRPIEAQEDEVRLKIYHAGPPIPLSDILPMLENMGIVVISEHPYDVRPLGSDSSVWIHDFDMCTAGGQPIDLSNVKDNFHDAFARIWRGEMENDGFNRLVLIGGLEWSDIVLLRAYSKYLRQAAAPFSQSYMEDTLADYPEIARLLIKLFNLRFDPKFRGQRDEQAEAVIATIGEKLEDVAILDQDRILRRFLNAIDSTLRTTYFQHDGDGKLKSYLSLKLDSQNIDELPLPKPFLEIFVYSPRMEAVHLRFGLVARGGLRWSDRREDFRTEILGLVKAQQVKNAVIVPVGSKGGFIVKRPPGPAASRQDVQDEGIACYKTFMCGMLDITDNLVDGKIVPPRDLVRRDGDDPYLVVAADKGTATFSDIANGISQDYGFWLDDAFASGGSAGYDHKAMGITARGAWESVKRHFRELGKDTQSQDFTVAGCGDMGGDVFGNGMLLSKHIRLQAAFNHLHIFLDPNPDAAASWDERKRLFDAAKGWDHYDKKLISKGGGVFDRRAKSVSLTPEIKKLLKLSKDSCPPNELLRAILRCDVELMWFGGIGTYIKESGESHAEVGDRANDSLRVNATEVGAKVIGEGANLGMTQRARIEYDLNGGRCNTDAIDNSAGVDCSDHEVNIKILLGDVERSGDITRKQRNQLLERMTEEVAALVLRDNYLQTQAISVTEQLGSRLVDRAARFMRALERQGKLHRAIEFLPDDETILERRKQAIGMTRPETSVLISYAKIVLYEELLASSLPDDPYMEADLRAYFPSELQEKHAERIGGHRLRREIIATQTTNSVINRSGFPFVHEVREKTGMSAEEICRAYAVAREVFGLRRLWQEIESLDTKVPSETQYAMFIECGRLIEAATTWLLRHCSKPVDITREIEAHGRGVEVIAGSLDTLLSQGDRQVLNQRVKAYVRKGVPEDLARSVAALRLLPPTLDIVRIAGDTGSAVGDVGETYFTIGNRFGFDWLRGAAHQLPTEEAWDKLAITAIIDDLYSHQTDLTLEVIQQANGKGAGNGSIEGWAEHRKPLITRTEQLLAELKAAGTPDLAMLAVANRQLKSLVAG